MTEAKVSGSPDSRSTEASGSERLEQRSERNHRRRGWSLFALLILVIGVIGSLVGGWSHYSAAKSAAKDAFDDRASAAAAELTAQLQHNIDLDGLVRALIGTQPRLTNAEFRKWFKIVNSGGSAYPDAVGFGYLERVPKAQLASFVRQEQADPVPGSPARWPGVVPAGNRPAYCLTRLGVWLLPVAFPPSLDVCATSDDQALLEAGATGNPTTLTSASTLGQVATYVAVIDGRRVPPLAGDALGRHDLLVLLEPVYRGNVARATTATRRRLLVGWTVALFDGSRLLDSAVPRQGHPRLRLLHEEPGRAPQVIVAVGARARSGDPTDLVRLHLSGPFLLEVTGPPIGGSSPLTQGLVVFLVGLLVTVLFSLLVFALSTSRARALDLVDEKTTELRRQALHDELTGLPNRWLILDRAEQLLARCRRRASIATVLFVDLDNFKDVNDTLGHAVGDELLQAVAERLEDAVREGDTVGRLGGDEFVILLEDDKLPSRGGLVAARILAELRAPIRLASQDRPLRITASIGIAMGDRTTAGDLLKDSDVALYRAKSLGKARYVAFETGMGSSVQEQVQLKADLQLAFAEEQFFLVYQPIIDLVTLEIIGAEALLRWQHPTRGVVAPLEFIPSLESTGLIVEVGRFVLMQACRQASLWQQQGLELTMNCNISARQLESDDLVQDLEAALQSNHLAPSSLVVEITESTVMKDVTGIVRRLNAFKALGVGIAIDDFGTGYSSLSYVHRFPVDVLKIDHSFVSVIDDTSSASMLVQVIVQLGSELGLEVIAEGIETMSQYEKLLAMGCKSGQGFMFAKPLDTGTFETFVRVGGAKMALELERLAAIAPGR
jgi:diguanylate cyclase (GGDEF)-like protein